MVHFLLGLAVGLAVAGCGASPEAVGTSGTSDDTGGSGGDATSPPAGGAGGAGGSLIGTGGAAGGVSATGGAGDCDALGACGNTGEGCVKCAIEGACAPQYGACFENGDCVDYSGCVVACAADVACVAQCDAQLPGAKLLFDAYQGCVICQECATSCSAMAATCPAP